MEYCEKSMIIAFYCIFLFCVLSEIIFLYLVPYYSFNKLLIWLKILRIIFGVINVLIDLFFLIKEYIEYLLKEEDHNDTESMARIYHLYDKILTIIAFLFSILLISFNIAGLVSSSKYVKKEGESSLHYSLLIDSILLLIENILMTLCWIYFLIFWGFNIKRFMKKEKIKTKKKIRIKSDVDPPPLPLSSSRNMRNEFNKP